MFDKLLEITDNKELLGLNDELKGLYINNYFNKYKGQVVFVVNSIYEANLFYQIIYNYTDKVLLFPMDDFLTSEALAISPELKTVRLETISKLSTGDEYIVITNLMGYLRYLPTLDIYKKNIIKLKVGDDLNIDLLRKKLFDIGYTKETVVNKTG